MTQLGELHILGVHRSTPIGFGSEDVIAVQTTLPVCHPHIVESVVPLIISCGLVIGSNCAQESCAAAERQHLIYGEGFAHLYIFQPKVKRLLQRFWTQQRHYLCFQDALMASSGWH